MTDATTSSQVAGSTVTSTSSESTRLKSLIGTGQARFLNQYNPLYDKAYEKPTLNTGTFIDADLAKMLEEERLSNQQHHKKKDFMKMYHDECVRYAAVTKGGKK